MKTTHICIIILILMISIILVMTKYKFKKRKVYEHLKMYPKIWEKKDFIKKQYN